MSLRAKPAALTKRYVRPATVGQTYVDLTGASTPRCIQVPVVPAKSASRLQCFYNVHNHVAEFDGEVVFGWALWLWPRVNVELVHHAIWRTPDGDLVDLTSPELAFDQIAFAPDEAAVFDFEDPIADGLPNDTRWLSDLPAIQNYRAAYEEHAYLDRVLGEHSKKNSDRWEAAKTSKDKRRTDVLETLANLCAPGDPCFCESGRTFGQCCRGNFT